MTYQPYHRVHIGLFPLGGPYDYRAPIPLRTHRKPPCNGFSSEVVLRVLEFLVASYVLFSRKKMVVANSTFAVFIFIGLLFNLEFTVSHIVMHSKPPCDLLWFLFGSSAECPNSFLGLISWKRLLKIRYPMGLRFSVMGSI